DEQQSCDSGSERTALVELVPETQNEPPTARDGDGRHPSSVGAIFAAATGVWQHLMHASRCAVGRVPIDAYRMRRTLLGGLLIAMVCAAAGASPIAVSERVRAIVAAADRSDADRALDAGRHPAEILAYFDVSPGMHLAELGAGGGYTTELLARSVG